MGLTGRQKKFIKKNRKKLSIREIALTLKIEEAEVLNYFKKRYSDYKTYKLGKLSSENNNRQDSKSSWLEKITSLNIRSQIFKNWHVFLLLAVFVLIAYANSFFNDFVSDDLGIKNNPNIGSLKAVFSNPLYTLRLLVGYIIYKFFGMQPFFYRLVNIAGHVGVVWLIYLIFGLFFSLTAGFFTASIFAVHPILVESVAWISGQMYVLYSFFFLLSFFFYILAERQKKYYVLSIISLIFSILFSEKAVSLFIVFIIYEIAFFRKKNRLVRLAPFILLTFFVLFLYTAKIGERVRDLTQTYYQSSQMYNPFIQIPVSATSYLQLIFWPDKLTLYHSEMSFSQLNYLIRLLIFIGFLGYTGYSYKKNKLIFFWLSFFMISLLPTLTPLGISWIVAERYVYLGTVGIIAAVVYYLSKLTQYKKAESIVYIFLILVFFSLMIRTIFRNFDWKNEDSLWLSTAKNSPSDPKTHNNLGDVYARRGLLKKSAEEFKKAIELNPQYADAYHNLGNTYQQMGNINEAVKNYQKALKINPSLWQSYQNTAAIYFSQKEYKQAEENIKKAISVFPQNANLFVNLGLIYSKMNDKVKAKQAYNKALEIDPNYEQAKIGISELNK